MVSIILATYNRANLLPRAIDSVLNQTTPNWQLVVIDDGSTDNTRSLVERYTFTNDERIIYGYQQNAGLAMTRNAGFRRSTGTFITFIDSDDEYRPEHIALRSRYFDEHPETDLLHGGVQIVGGPDYVRDVNDPLKHIPLADCFIGGTFFMRRQVFEELEGFRPPDYGTDYQFAQRALQQFTIAKIDAPTYVYHRETPDSLCNLMEKSCG